MVMSDTANTSRYALITHSISLNPVRKLSMMEGMAMLTMVPSKSNMKSPMHKTANTPQRPG